MRLIIGFGVRSLFAAASWLCYCVVGSLGLDAFQELRGGLVVGVLRDQLATEGFGKNGLIELGYR